MSEQGSAGVVDEQGYERFDCTGDQLPRGAAAAREAINRDECVVIPTDTVYGIGADAFSAEAVQRLLDAKGRGRDMPPPVLIADTPILRALATDVPAQVDQLVARHWPGPLTVICKAQRSLQMDLGDTNGTIALRVPDHDVARTLLRRTGPLAVSSANRSGQPAATDVDDAIAQLGGRVSVYLDAGPTPGPVSSSIVDFTQSEEGVLVREGVLSLEVLQETLPGLLVSDTVAAQRLAAAEAATAAAAGGTAGEPAPAEPAADEAAHDEPTADEVAADGAPSGEVPVDGGGATPTGQEPATGEPVAEAAPEGTEPAVEPGSGPDPVTADEGTRLTTTEEGTQVLTAEHGAEVSTSADGSHVLRTGEGTEVVTPGDDDPGVATAAGDATVAGASAEPDVVPAEVVATEPEPGTVEVEHGSLESEVVPPVRAEDPVPDPQDVAEDVADPEADRDRGRAPDA